VTIESDKDRAKYASHGGVPWMSVPSRNQQGSIFGLFDVTKKLQSIIIG
jgi:hypothetical protein